MEEMKENPPFKILEVKSDSSRFAPYFQVYSLNSDEDQKLTQKKDSTGKRVTHAFGLAMQDFRQSFFEHELYVEILKGRLLLGSQPKDSSKYSLGKKDLVVSVNEKHEFTGTAFSVVLSTEWPNHHHLPVTDHTADMDTELTIDTLWRMKETFDAGGKVLVHCKAGLGRSAIVVAMFLVYLYFCRDDSIKEIFENVPESPTLENLLFIAATHVIKDRKGANLKGARFTVALGILDKLQHHMLNNIEKIEDRSADHQFLQALVQSNEFKAVVIRYADVSTSKRAESLQLFFDALRMNENSWPKMLEETRFQDTQNPGEGLGHLSHAKRFGKNETNSGEDFDTENLLDALHYQILCLIPRYSISDYAIKYTTFKENQNLKDPENTGHQDNVMN